MTKEELYKFDLLSKYLGIGNHKKSDIWFLGNEEKSGKNENHKERINNNKNYFTIPNNIDFSKDNGWEGFNIINEVTYFNGNNMFIGDFYFLPASGGNDIGKKYNLGEGKSRDECYEIDFLNLLLNKRLNYLFDLLFNSKKIVVIIGNAKGKINLLKNKIKKFTGKEAKILFKGENKDNKIQEVYFGKSRIIITNFFSNTFNQDKELKELLNYNYSSMFGKNLKTGFYDGLIDTGDKCPECNKRILDYRLEEGIEKCENPKCGYDIII